MKEKHEQYDKEDLELLTELKNSIPRDFHSYMHMLSNTDFLCAFLAGEDSLVRRTWESAVDHARKNENYAQITVIPTTYFIVVQCMTLVGVFTLTFNLVILANTNN